MFFQETAQEKSTNKRWRVGRKIKGFTLVELLLVIVIIGILASAALLASGSAQDTAKATTILSDLRTFKSAILLFIADNPDSSDKELKALEIDQLAKYMDNSDKYAGNGHYDTQFMRITNKYDETTDYWCIVYGGAGVLDTGVKKKLTEWADRYRLRGANDVKNGIFNERYNNHNYVAMTIQ